VTARWDTDDGLAPVGDDLGRCYTDDTLADAFVSAISWPAGLSCPLVLEPSVGGGSFARAVRRRWPGATIIGVDIDPDAAGLREVDVPIVADWPTIARHWDRLEVLRPFRVQTTAPKWRVKLAVGNPPFGLAVGIDVTIDHVVSAVELASSAAFILPLPYVCGSEFDLVWRRRRPARLHRVLDRPWPTRLREVVGMEWWSESTGTDTVDLDWRRAG
jgi:predicted RNA methylase